MTERSYIAIDLKSFYASVECAQRGLDPLKTNLVVADVSRTEKTICLAVTPSLKAYGISGRARLFEVVQQVNAVNAERLHRAPNHQFTGSSCNADELKDPSLKLDYIAAPPQMGLYLKRSAEIYGIYLRYIAPEDIHVYSIDEVFIDATPYLKTYRMTARELAMKLIREVLQETGITATAGIGTNLYLCKIAMDIVAKKMPADKDGVRIAELTEQSYREQLWSHRPLTDFWRVGHGYAKKLEKHGLFTMGDIARCSVGKKGEYYNEDLLYKLFGVNAELLIDHAWGWEPCTIEAIKRYKPASNSLSSGQVLTEPYSFEKARIVVREMADAMAYDMAEKGLVTDQMVLTVCYDVENLLDEKRRQAYQGVVVKDYYGREIPQHSHGTANLDCRTSSAKAITQAVVDLYDRITDKNLLVRRMFVVANRVTKGTSEEAPEQLDLFGDLEKKERQQAEEEKQQRMQQTVLSIRRKYGKNAILKGMNYQEGATAAERNNQIGGHKK